MPQANTARDESSVVVALQGPMGLEDERRRREEEQRLLAEAAERERMLAFQLEMKRISAQHRGVPAWTVGAAAVIFLVIIGVGTAFYLSEASSYQQRIADLRGAAEQVENRAAAEVEQARAELGLTTARAETAERLVNALRGKVASLEDQLQTLETARSGARPKPQRRAGKPGRVEQIEPQGGARPLSDDPLDGDFKID